MGSSQGVQKVCKSVKGDDFVENAEQAVEMSQCLLPASELSVPLFTSYFSVIFLPITEYKIASLDIRIVGTYDVMHSM